MGVLLVSQGLAIVRYLSLKSDSDFYYGNLDYINQLTQAETQAKKQKLGLWKNPENFTKIFPNLKNRYQKIKFY